MDPLDDESGHAPQLEEGARQRFDAVLDTIAAREAHRRVRAADAEHRQRLVAERGAVELLGPLLQEPADSQVRAWPEHVRSPTRPHLVKVREGIQYAARKLPRGVVPVYVAATILVGISELPVTAPTPTVVP